MKLEEQFLNNHEKSEGIEDHFAHSNSGKQYYNETFKND